MVLRRLKIHFIQRLTITIVWSSSTAIKNRKTDTLANSKTFKIEFSSESKDWLRHLRPSCSHCLLLCPYLSWSLMAPLLSSSSSYNSSYPQIFSPISRISRAKTVLLEDRDHAITSEYSRAQTQDPLKYFPRLTDEHIYVFSKNNPSTNSSPCLASSPRTILTCNSEPGAHVLGNLRLSRAHTGTGKQDSPGRRKGYTRPSDSLLSLFQLWRQKAE